MYVKLQKTEQKKTRLSHIFFFIFEVLIYNVKRKHNIKEINTVQKDQT